MTTSTPAASAPLLHGGPDVPTFEGSGYPDFEVAFWQGLVVPAGTPREIVRRLSADLARTRATPEVRQRFEDAGMELGRGSPDDMAKVIRDDQAFWVPMIRKLGISVD